MDYVYNIQNLIFMLTSLIIFSICWILPLKLKVGQFVHMIKQRENLLKNLYT